MALTVYRYRRDAPFTDAQLVKLAGTGAANVAAAGGPVFDVQIDDSRLADLDYAMGLSGYARIATAPVGTPSTQLREAGGTILTLGAVAEGQSVIRSGTSLLGGTGFDVRDLLIHDHFLTGNADLSELGLMGWETAAAGTGNNVAIAGEAGHPGVVRLQAGTVAAGRAAIHLGDTTMVNVAMPGVGNNPLTFEALVSLRVDIGAPLQRIQIGLGSGWNLADPNPLTDGVYLRYEPGTDTNWTGVTANASTRTTVDLGVLPVLNAWLRVGFVITGGATPSVQFRINGVDAGTPITTNLPATFTGFGFRVDANGGGINPELDIDYVFATQVTNKET